MRDAIKHHPVNWIDGMKINKTHFTAQDNAMRAAVTDAGAFLLSPIRFGLLPAGADGQPFNVSITTDNQRTVRVSVLSCEAVTSGGARIHLPAITHAGMSGADGAPSATLPVATSTNDAVWWIVLIINPYDHTPAGAPDLSETPPRLPFALPAYTVHIVPESQFRQYATHPYALAVGKLIAAAGDVRADEDYIPPCMCVSAHPDLMALHAELDQFLGRMEQYCAVIVQKIFRKSQQNDLSELVQFLCDRTIMYLSQAITQVRWVQLHESPVALFATMAGLARVLKNSIDLRTGSGRDELMNYFAEWCDLKQGELEALFSQMASMTYDHNDVNQNIGRIARFAKVTGKLFETLAGLEFIGKKKESGIFVKEEQHAPAGADAAKPKRRFFG